MMASENNQPTATLFHIPFGSSSRVVNIIHELGIENKVAVEILPSWAETKSEWYLKLHPQGKVPVYIEGDKSSPSLVLKESVAICLYLLEKFDTEGRLYPKDVVGRGKVLQYALFAASQAYPIISDMWAQGPENVYGDPLDKTPRIVASLNKRWEQVILPFIATELGNQQFLLGDKPTAADFILAYDAICSNHYKLPLNNSIVEAWHKRVMAIPSFAKTYFGN